MTPQNLDLERVYEYRFHEIEQTGREVVWEEIARFVHERLGRPQRVLDPAAGRGEFINAVPAAERWGVDQVAHSPGPEQHGVRMVISPIMEADLPSGYFDAVFVSNFLEHLPTPEDVAAFLAKMLDVLKPGGRIAILGPNIRYCADEYWDCADHYLALTHIAVEEHLFAAGFDVTRVADRFLPYSFRGRFPASARLTRTYLAAPFVWRFLGKQFLVEGRRPVSG